MNWILENWYFLVEGFGFIVSVITAFVLFFRTKDVKYLKEVKDMAIKYKTPASIDVLESKAQTFEHTRPVYRLNKATGELEMTDEVIDIDELVNSCKDVCLQACLERFMPKEDTDDDLTLYNDMIDDLDVMSDVLDRVEDYREYFNLDGASVEEVFNYVGQHADELKKKLESANKIKTEDSVNGKVSQETEDVRPSEK